MSKTTHITNITIAEAEDGSYAITGINKEEMAALFHLCNSAAGVTRKDMIAKILDGNSPEVQASSKILEDISLELKITDFFSMEYTVGALWLAIMDYFRNDGSTSVYNMDNAFTDATRMTNEYNKSKNSSQRGTK